MALFRIGNLILQIDADDVARIRTQRWSAVQSGERFALTTSTTVDGIKKKITLQRLIMRPKKGEWVCRLPGTDPLDFRKSCFVIGTMTDRQSTLSKKKKGTSRFKGVSFCRRSHKWVASIRPAGRSINLGRFENERDAAAAYNRAALFFFGENAFINDLDEDEPRPSVQSP